MDVRLKCLQLHRLIVICAQATESFKDLLKSLKILVAGQIVFSLPGRRPLTEYYMLRDISHVSHSTNPDLPVIPLY